MESLSLKDEPLHALSKKAVPKALHLALQEIYNDVPSKSVWLVGGTALAGFYAQHRRSDDLDLFANEEGFEPCIRAVRNLLHHGAKFSNELRSPLYYRAFCKYHSHDFTIDVVKDTFLHQAGTSHQSSENICFASLVTLFGMKCSTLISRASEKDLFDLLWIFHHNPTLKISDVITEGQKFDGGLTPETLLIGLHGSKLNEQACHFSLTKQKIQAKKIFKEISDFQKLLIKKILEYQKNAPLDPVTKTLQINLKDFK